MIICVSSCNEFGVDTVQEKLFGVQQVFHEHEHTQQCYYMPAQVLLIHYSMYNLYIALLSTQTVLCAPKQQMKEMERGLSKK